LGQLKSMLALLIYVSVGGHLMLLSALSDSLRTLPPGTALDLARGGHAVMGMVPTLYSCALRAAAPVMITLLLSNLALAVVSRAVPQLNTMMVSLPVMMALGLMMFGAALPLVASALRGWMLSMPGTTAQLLRAFEPVR
ncbi:MAG: flagellar biosynthetic protein FliR, partial [Gaiellaceae bacterium]